MEHVSVTYDEEYGVSWDPLILGSTIFVVSYLYIDLSLMGRGCHMSELMRGEGGNNDCRNSFSSISFGFSLTPFLGIGCRLVACKAVSIVYDLSVTEYPGYGFAIANDRSRSLEITTRLVNIVFPRQIVLT